MDICKFILFEERAWNRFKVLFLLINNLLVFTLRKKKQNKIDDFYFFRQ